MAVTRQEVEQELERKSASIAGSISRIKKELSLPIEPIRSTIKNHPVEVMLGTVAAGLAIGWLLSGRRKSRKQPPSQTSQAGAALGASEFLNFVRAGKASGLNEEDAVSRALAATSPGLGPQTRRSRIGLTDRLTDYVVDMAEAMIKTAMRVAASEAAGWVAESVRREKPKPSQ